MMTMETVFRPNIVSQMNRVSLIVRRGCVRVQSMWRAFTLSCRLLVARTDRENCRIRCKLESDLSPASRLRQVPTYAALRYHFWKRHEQQQRAYRRDKKNKTFRNRQSSWTAANGHIGMDPARRQHFRSSLERIEKTHANHEKMVQEYLNNLEGAQKISQAMRPVDIPSSSIHPEKYCVSTPDDGEIRQAGACGPPIQTLNSLSCKILKHWRQKRTTLTSFQTSGLVVPINCHWEQTSALSAVVVL